MKASKTGNVFFGGIFQIIIDFPKIPKTIRMNTYH
jgi:hypothetical protein